MVYTSYTPKEVFTALDDQYLLIAHIASPISVQNIRRNPNVCVSFIDVFKQKGYKLKGQARVQERDDAGFSERHALLYKLAGDRFPIKGVIEVKVTETAPIAAPSYYLYPQTTETSQIESAMRNYGVHPRQ